MSIFDYIKDNFLNYNSPLELMRLLDKGFVIQNDGAYFDVPGIQTADGSTLYLICRAPIGFYVTTYYPELAAYLPKEDGSAPDTFPTGFSEKMNSVKTRNLKISSFPIGINVDEGIPEAVPA